MITQEEKESCWITTVSGKRFFPFDPNPESIDIFDIAHSLANLCRFNGHTLHFYSVAEHSVRVSNLVSAENKLWALLHDASEAYICDIARPIKHTHCMESYRMLEQIIMEAIADKFGLQGNEIPEEVKAADFKMLLLEKRDLIPHAGTQVWEGEFEVHGDTIIPFSPEVARGYFINTFLTLTRG